MRELVLVSNSVFHLLELTTMIWRISIPTTNSLSLRKMDVRVRLPLILQNIMVLSLLVFEKVLLRYLSIFVAITILKTR